MSIFAIDAQADWGVGELEFTVLGRADSRPRYRVAAFVAHENHADVGARQRMRSGHYVAHTLSGDRWFELSDEMVSSANNAERCEVAQFPHARHPTEGSSRTPCTSL